MQLHHSTRGLRIKLGTSLALLGISLWVAAVVVHVTPVDARDVTVPHMEARLLGIVAGGAAVAGGIVLMAAA